jgi:UDP-2-acetamido-3-amino-2,3-dideoxy-glucuronate N-acetyltransferase
MDYFAHDTACVDPGAEIGAGTRIWHFTHIMTGARLGRGCNIGQNVFVQTGVIIGNNVKLQNNVFLPAGVLVEDDVFFGPSAVCTNVINPRSHVPRRDQFRTTLFKVGSTVGANSTVVCGTTIGRYAFIGAGSVVTRDVADYALVYGNPARPRGWVCQCGVKLAFDGTGDARATCAECGASYLRQHDSVQPTVRDEPDAR